MAQNNHFHKFRRDSYSTGRKFYYCINGNCTFKCDVKHSLGKEVICNECGLRFHMNEYSIRMAKPKCMNCVKRRTLNPEVKENKSANNVERIESNVSTPTTTVSDLKERLNNLTIKEYNPEVDDNDL